MIKTITHLLLVLSLSGCALWPYKSDFDCPVPEGDQCQSLYQTNIKADQGTYAPPRYEDEVTHHTNTHQKTQKLSTKKKKKVKPLLWFLRFKTSPYAF